MKAKEFEKTIEVEQLAKRDDTNKFMLKSYLDCLLKGGKIRDVAYLYAVGNVSAIGQSVSPYSVELAIKLRRRAITDWFKGMKKDGKWVVEGLEIYHYDENGELIDGEDLTKKPTISRMVEVTTKETFYLHRPLDIKPLDKEAHIKKLMEGSK